MTEEYNEFIDYERLEREAEEKKELWRKSRIGKFTGSRIKELMNCSKDGSKLSWIDINKTFCFGEKAIKYIHKTMMERLTGIESMEVTSRQMQHGKDMEPVFVEQLELDSIFVNAKEFDLLKDSPEVEYLGATPDRYAFSPKHKKNVVAETKCCVSWEGTGWFNRIGTTFDEKHQDFWQVQAEMECTETDLCLYCVAMPMQTEKYEVVEVERSDIHIKAMRNRVRIANRAIELCTESSDFSVQSLRSNLESVINEVSSSSVHNT